MNRYDKRVSRGAAYLDARAGERWGSRYANWRNRIDLGKLDVDEPRMCVLGQLFTSFYFAPERFSNVLWLLRHGFTVPGTSYITVLFMGDRGSERFKRRRRRLNEAWRSYIINERVRQSAEVH